MSETQSTNPVAPVDHLSAMELCAIGHVETPFNRLEDCPRNIRVCDHETWLVLDPAYEPAMRELSDTTHLIVLYWLDKSERSTLRKVTPFDGKERGVFATRSPNRPNPIGHAALPILAIDGLRIKVGPMDCLNGTLLIDIKPYISTTDCYPDAKLDWIDNLAPDVLSENAFTGTYK